MDKWSKKIALSHDHQVFVHLYIVLLLQIVWTNLDLLMASPGVAGDPSEVLKHTPRRYFDRSHQSVIVHYSMFQYNYFTK